jgi:hypothetical protein
MALRWDCDAAAFSFTVPPQGHYSVYQVDVLRCSRMNKPGSITLARRSAEEYAMVTL